MLRCKPTGPGLPFLHTSAAIPSTPGAFLLLVPQCLFATDRSWSGNGSGVNWSSAGNWNLGSAPTSGSITDLVFAGTTNTGKVLTPLNENIATPLPLNFHQPLILNWTAGAGVAFVVPARKRRLARRHVFRRSTWEGCAE